MKLVSVVAAMAVVMASGASHAQLRGPERSNFLTGFNRACMAGFRSNQMMVDVPSRSVTSICSCVSRRVADTIDYSDTWSRYKLGSSPQVPPELQDAMMEAAQYCVSRRSDGFAPMKVTPNH